jgi:hypothetical protein
MYRPNPELKSKNSTEFHQYESSTNIHQVSRIPTKPYKLTLTTTPPQTK